MVINSYTIWKSGPGKSSSSNLIGSDDVLFIFLRAFPNIEHTFFSTGSLTFTPDQEHFDFIELEINTRLTEAEKKATWRSDWDQQKIEFIRRAGHLHKIKFQDKEFEINTFGQIENTILVELVNLYDTFMESKGGLKITTEWGFDGKWHQG